MTKLEQAQDTIKFVRQQTDEVILFNSFGKDSLVVLDLIAPYFKRVVCVFMYFVPDLDHINRFINQVICRYNNVEVVQIPHWNLTYIQRGGMYSVTKPKNEEQKKQKLLKLRDIAEKCQSYYRLGLPRYEEIRWHEPSFNAQNLRGCAFHEQRFCLPACRVDAERGFGLHGAAPPTIAYSVWQECQQRRRL